MSYWIEGWVEATLSTKDEDELIWLDVLDVGTLIDGSDDVSEQLFGLSKRCSSNEYEGRSLFARRGVPTDCTPQIQHQADSIKELERTGQAGAFTFASWKEIKNVELPEELLQDSGWRVVFGMVELLERSGRYTDEQIRFVAWFIW